MKNKKQVSHPPLVFWFDTPPRAGAGVFQKTSLYWPGEVYYFCLKGFRQERLRAGWQECSYQGINKIMFSELSNPQKYLQDFTQKFPNAIHIKNGFRGANSVLFKKYVFSNPKSQVGIYSERPAVWGSPWKKLLKRFFIPIVYRYYIWSLRKSIKLILTMGNSGIKTFARLGCNPRILYPFMYVPEEPAALPQQATPATPRKIRFVYVGRLSAYSKGVDLLEKVFNQLKEKNWHLDIVGKNGEYEEQIIRWAEQHPQVSYLGAWPSQEVIPHLSQYDVCLIPSRHDGCNVVVNEALTAGIGVVTTDTVATDDLISASGAGIVLPAGNAQALLQAVSFILKQPEIIQQWHSAARNYRPLISSDSAAQYLVEVLNHVFLHPEEAAPQCPWLK